MNIKKLEQVEDLYDNVFSGRSEEETFIHNDIVYKIKYEYGQKLPKFFYGVGICETFKLTDMRKIIKGEKIKQKIVPKPRKYWVS